MCRSLWHIFHGPIIFVLYLWLYLIDKHHAMDTCSVSHCEWSHIFEGHCDLYIMVHWFCLVSMTLSNSKASYFGYLFSRHCQWLHTICWSLWPTFHGPLILPHIFGSFWWIRLVQFHTGCDLLFLVGHCDQWFCLVFPTLSSRKSSCSCSVRHCQLLHTVCSSLWPIFQGPVILPFIAGPIE